MQTRQKLGVRVYRFHHRLEQLQAAADLVVGMGGYNTVCETLTSGIPSLLIPRETPRKEQLIRAKILYEHHLADYIPWQSCSPDTMRKKLFAMLKNSERYKQNLAWFEMTGLKTISDRFNTLNSVHP